MGVGQEVVKDGMPVGWVLNKDTHTWFCPDSLCLLCSLWSCSCHGGSKIPLAASGVKEMINPCSLGWACRPCSLCHTQEPELVSGSNAGLGFPGPLWIPLGTALVQQDLGRGPWLQSRGRGLR